MLDLREVYNDTVQNGTINVYYRNELIYTTEVENGNATLVLRNDTFEHYVGNNVKLEYISNKHYANKTYDIIVDKVLIMLNATSNKTVFIGDNVTVFGNVTEAFCPDLNGSVDIIINGNDPVTVKLENGAYNYTFTSNITGVNNITVTLNDVEIPHNFTAAEIVNITDSDEIIPVLADGNPYRDGKVNITVKATVTDSEGNPYTGRVLLKDSEGKVIGEINNDDVTSFNDVALSDSNLEIVAENGDEIKFTSTVKITGPDNDTDHVYGAEERFHYLTVDTVTNVTSIDLDVTSNKTVLLGDTVTVTGNVTELFGTEYDGTVNITIDDKTPVTVPVENGTYTYTFTPEVPGVHNISVSIDKGDITVNTTDTTVINSNNDHTNIVFTDGNPFEDAVNITVNAIFKDDKGKPYTGDVKVIFNDTADGEQVVHVTNGQLDTTSFENIFADANKMRVIVEGNVTFDVNFTATRNKTITVDIDGSEDAFKNVTANTTVNVSELNITVTANKTVNLTDTVTVNGTVTDNFGNPYDGTVYIKYGDEEPVEVTVTNGVYSTTFTADEPGVQKVQVTLKEGTLTYNFTDTTVTDVSNDVIVDNPFKDNGKVNVTIDATFTDDNDEPYTGSVEVRNSNGDVITTINVVDGKCDDVLTDIEADDIVLVPTTSEGTVTFQGKVTITGTNNDTIDVDGIENRFKDLVAEAKVNVTVPTEIPIDVNNPLTAHTNATATINLVNNRTSPREVITDIGKDNVVIVVKQGNEELPAEVVFDNSTGEFKVTFISITDEDVTINATFKGESYYLPISNETTVKVNPLNTSINVTVQNTTINGTTDIIVDIKDANGNNITSGKVILSFNDTDETVEITLDGSKNQIVHTFDNTTEGRNITVTATYVPVDTGYVANESSEEFTVAKINTTIDITPINIVAHNTSSVNITLYNCTPDGTGVKDKIVAGEDLIITVTQDGEPLNVTTTVAEDGSIIVSFTPENGSDVNVTAIYNGNEYVYNGNSSSNKFSVDSIDTKLTVNATNTTINGTSLITVNVTDGNDKPVIGGIVELTFKDTEGNTVIVPVEVQSGIATFTYPASNTTVGKDVNVTAKYLKNDTLGYNASEEADTNFTVNKLNTSITIDAGSPVAHNETTATITLLNYTLSGEIGVGIPGEQLNITVTQDGKDLPFTIETNITGTDGVVTIKYTPLTASPVNITAIFNDTKVYNGARHTNLTTPKPIGTTLELGSTDTIINGTSTISIKVTDENGENVVGGIVKLEITDSEGNTATIPVEVHNGTATYIYTSENTTVGKNVSVKGSYVANETLGYKASEENTTDFVVDKLNSTVSITPSDNIVAHNISTVTIGLKNNTEHGLIGDKDLVGEKLNVTVTQNGTELNVTDVTIDEEGNAIVSFIPLNTLPITVNATYNGNKVYNGDDEEITIETSDIKYIGTHITVSAENTVINDTSNIKVTVTDDNDEPINGIVELTFTDTEGNTARVNVTITDGEGEYTYPALNTTVHKDVIVVGKYIANETYGYNTSTANDQFNVARLNTTIEIDPGNPVAHNATNATITLKNLTKDGEVDKGVPGEDVHVIIKDANGHVLFDDTNKTDDDGTVNVTYTPVDGSEITITATFEITKVYFPTENSSSVTPEEIGTKLVLNSANTIVDGTSTIGINVTDANNNPVNGTVELTVTDDKGNEYTVLVPVENGVGTYTYPSNQTDMGKVVNVTGYYVENETLGYKASEEANTTFNVDKLNTTVDLVVNNATITNFTVNITVEGKETDRTVLNGTVDIYADNVLVATANITDGKADNVWLNITEIGDYTLSVTYNGNDVFNENNSFTKDVTAIKINTTTTVGIVNNTVGNVTLDAVVHDVNGNIVTEGVVNITAKDEEGNEYYIGEAEIIDGKATIKNTTLTGNKDYNFTANYEGTPTYEISNNNTIENIETKPTTTTIEVLNNTFENVTVKVTVVDEETGNPIPNGDVNIILPDGRIIPVKTDENGTNITTFDDIPVGQDKEFNANYLGNDTYTPSEDQTTTDIAKRPSITTPTVTNNTAGNVTLDVQVTDAEDGRNLTEGNITIYAKLADEEDSQYVPVGTGSINENGTATITTNITSKGNYTFRADFEGNTNYTESNGNTDEEVVGRLADIGAIPGNETLGNSTVIVSLNDSTLVNH